MKFESGEGGERQRKGTGGGEATNVGRQYVAVGAERSFLGTMVRSVDGSRRIDLQRAVCVRGVLDSVNVFVVGGKRLLLLEI